MKVKNADTIYYMLTSLVSFQQGNVKKSKKSMKIINIEGENLNIFWTTWGYYDIFNDTYIIKSHKKAGFDFGGGGQFDPPSNLELIYLF